ncbi:alpha-1,2-fucosyltransferase [Polaribacter batillariae]|uniref:Alpha-1,2-fucosyltransferase n=1 Tax=Polaribacter batillariae TaxID=2808900 RepID=A0ABX7SVZ4_9FLAO|nr:alpha-1,2-fucosyltransferase [Polaribacter batillariae]QTD37470.1 alpha-1,2-fucosyltransferase [Polaribacter batillariae]
MIIVRILGGLGNQMFQYAYAKALEQQGCTVKLDVSAFKKYKLHGGYHLDKYKIDLKYASNFTNLMSKITFFQHKKEKSLLFDASLKSLKGNKYVKGYFQTEKYFSEIRTILLEQFTIIDELSTSTKNYKKQILEANTSCSLHIRRGDYVSDKKANTVHGTCSLDYYEKAIKLIKKEHKEVHFFIFSDDISWTKENLTLENAIYIDHKTIPHEDMYLMSICNHNITANSSFSWWGAWLNTFENKTIIAPKQWFVNKENEIACENWIKI